MVKRSQELPYHKAANMSRLSTVSATLCIAGASLGILGLLGWITNTPSLYTVVPGQPAMMPNTGASLTIIGLIGALLVSTRPGVAVRALFDVAALPVLVVGIGTLAEYVLSRDLHIDRLLLHSNLGPYPGRPSPPTAMSLALLGLTILLYDRPRGRAGPSEWLLIWAALTALVGIAGQILGVGAIYHLPRAPVIGMSVPTTLSLLLSSLGMLLGRQPPHLLAVVTSGGPGGVLLRRIALPLIIVPMLFGFGITRLYTVLDAKTFPLAVATFTVAITATGVAILVVTARLLERSHDALLASRARTQEIIALASDGIFIADLDGVYLDVNEAGSRMLGMTRSEIVGRRIRDFIPPDEVSRLDAARAELLAGGTQIAEWRLRHRTGVYIPVEVSTTMLPRGRWQAFVRDISARKAAEEAARQAAERERQRAEQDRLLAAIGLLLTSSLEREELVNGAANLLVGTFADLCVIDLVDDPGASLAVTRTAVVHRDPQKQALAGALQALQLDQQPPHLSGEPLQTKRTRVVARVTPEYLDSIARSEEHRRLLRELAPNSVISVPLRARGTIVGVLTFALTESSREYEESDALFAEEIGKRLALAIDNARLFETATKAITARDEVLRVVAHDLRNPLGTILMRASLLQMNGGDGGGGVEHNGDRRATAAAIEKTAKRMNRLIQDLLDVSKSEAGRLSVERTCVSASEIVRDAVAAQLRLAAEASIELRIEIPSDLPDVRGDRDRLFQIFENLIGNAIKFTTSRGRIAVGAVCRDDDVLFWVKDSGEGIAAEDLPHVFDRFWQGRKRTSEGAGLGLLIVKALVEAHGGRVWVESALGRGSTFFFTIPRANQARAEGLASEATD